MEKKKGFTLVELIISITLLAIIGITIGVSLNRVNKQKENEDKNVVISKIKSAADAYLTSNRSELNELYTNKAYILITIGELKTSGLLSEDLIDPDTGTKISNDAYVKASFDANGTVVYTYPAKVNDEDYVQALNLYMEKGEDVTCWTGINTTSFAYVDSETGKYDRNWFKEKEPNKEYEHITCTESEWKDEYSQKVGTYLLHYSYTLKDGRTKTFTRKFIVQDEVEIYLTATTNTSNKKVFNDKWVNEAITIKANPKRAAKIDYWWHLENSSAHLGDTQSLVVDKSIVATYVLEYSVNNINDNGTNNNVAYSGKKEFPVKIELSNDIIKMSPNITGGGEKWFNTPIEFTVSSNSEPISGIKEYEYCTTSSCTNWTKLSKTNPKFTTNVLDKNIVSAKFVTEAGNESESVKADAWFDNVNPELSSGNVSGNTAATSYIDSHSGVSKTYYSSNYSGSTPTVGDGTWTESSSVATPGCGNTNFVFSYALDNAGNNSVVNSIGYVQGATCYYGGYVDTGGTSTGTTTPTCDEACQIQNTAAYWQENCPGCTQEQFNDYLQDNEPNGIDVGGGTVVKNYDNVEQIREEGGLEYDPVGSCTVNVTCPSSSGSGTNTSSSGTSTGGDMDLSACDDLSNMDLSGLDDLDFSGIGDIHIDPIGPIDVCLVKGTKVLLADGVYKNIEDVDYEDLLTTYNFDSGKLGLSYPGWIEKEQKTESYQNNVFDDGTELNTVGYHGVFDCDKNIFISVDDEDSFKVGTRILKFNGNEKYCATVTEINKVIKPTTYYHVESVRYEDIIANNFLTTDGNVTVANIFGFTKDQKYPAKKVIIESDRKRVFEIEETEHNGIKPDKHLFEALYFKRTKYLTNLADIKNDPEVAIALTKLNYFLMSPEHQLLPEQSANGLSMWKVTTSDDYLNSKTNYEEGSFYTLPEPNVKTNFSGWYNSGDNKIYYPGDKVEVYYAMHFVALYN